MDADAADGFGTLGVALVRTPSYFFWSGMELSTEASFVCESPQGRKHIYDVNAWRQGYHNHKGSHN